MPPNGAGWINIDVTGGGTYTSAVFSEVNPHTDGDYVFEISYGTTSEYIGPGSAPLPALAGTLPGFAAAVLGMLGLRRRSRRT